MYLDTAKSSRNIAFYPFGYWPNRRRIILGEIRVFFKRLLRLKF